MSSLDKMWVSLLSIGLMAISSALVLFARNKVKNRFIRILIMLIALILFFYGFIFMIISIL